ncbi:MAG: transposase [Candidatus Omnitrophica bacterium]|nr:transposase [Candidatus Omnitrophota bacterium]
MKPHYPRIRRVKTHSKSIAIQFGYYKGKRFKLLKHIGSSKDINKINELVDIAEEYISAHSNQLKLNFNQSSTEILFKRGIKVEENRLQEAYDYLSQIYSKIGVVVNEIGFPIYYDIFPGNTFEGKTIIPVILRIIKKHQINKFTVIADAGMLSEKNLIELEKNGIDYVVGARTGNLSLNEARNIAKRNIT